VGIVRIKAVVFDFDGTLVVFNINYIAVRKEIIDRIAEMDIPKDIFSVENPLRVTLRQARDLLSEDKMEQIERDAENIISFYEIEGAKSNSIKLEVSEVLKTLKEEMNLKLAIFTLNQKKSVEIILNKANLFEIFDTIVTRNSVRDFYQNIIKLRYLRTCLGKLGVDGKEIIVVGDHPIDIEAGNILNAITIGVHTPRNGKELQKDEKYDYLLYSINELPEVVQKVMEL
jgi:phosphoglycolate phosphatase-like HAD superfamily hydrolase